MSWICIGNSGFDGFDFELWFDNMILKLEKETKAVTGEEERRRRSEVDGEKRKRADSWFS